MKASDTTSKSVSIKEIDPLALKDFFSKQKEFIKKRDLKNLPLSLLSVKIRKAKDLKNVEYFTVTDPFIVVECGNAPMQYTDIVDNNLEPNWDQTLHFVVGNPKEYYQNQESSLSSDICRRTLSYMRKNLFRKTL